MRLLNSKRYKTEILKYLFTYKTPFALLLLLGNCLNGDTKTSLFIETPYRVGWQKYCFTDNLTDTFLMSLLQSRPLSRMGPTELHLLPGVYLHDLT